MLRNLVLCKMVRPQAGPIAQRLERRTHNPLVPGSNPGGPTNFSITCSHCCWRAGLLWETLCETFCSFEDPDGFSFRIPQTVKVDLRRHPVFVSQEPLECPHGNVVSFHQRSTTIPQRMRSCQDLFDLRSLNSLSECISVTTISISNQKSWSAIPGERLQQPLRRPFRSGMSRDVGMHDSSAMMLKHNKHELEPETQRGHCEENDRDKLLGMIFQEGPPRLGRRLAVSRHVCGDGGFRYLDPEFQQFPVNSGRTPDRIRQAHLTDQRSNLGRNFRSAGKTFALPLPVKTKTFSMPGNHSLRSDED